MTSAARRRFSALRARRSAIGNLKSKTPSRRPCFETLESRQLLALVSYWSGDNTAVDPISGNNGTLYNGATYAAGQVGQAFSFDGVNDRLNVADSPSLALTQSLTIEAWVKVDGITPSGGRILFRGDDRGGLDPYQLSVSAAGNLSFQISSLTQGATIDAPISLGQFVHVAATLDDATGEMKLYENGALVEQATTTVRPFADLDPASNPGVGIGNHGGYPTTPHNFPFNGLIDELRVFDHALTPSEILADFNAQKGSLTPTISVSDATGTEGDTRFALNLGPLVDRGSNGGLMRSSGMAFGPDGNLYIGSFSTNEILRYDANTGAFLGPFVTSGSGGLTTPSTNGLIFRPDGKLYVLSRDGNSVLRYDAATGAFVDTFVANGSGGLSQPRGMTFGPDDNLYITSTLTSEVLKYNGTTGAFLGAFVTAGSGGLTGPRSLAFGPDGSLFVASPPTNSVLRYNGTTGAFISTMVPSGSGGLQGTGDLVFDNGSLYVASQSTNEVLRYSAISGAFLDVVEPRVAGSLDRPVGLVVAPSGNLLVGDYNSVVRYAKTAQATVVVSLSVPWPNAISVDFSTGNENALAGADFAAASGSVTFTPGKIAQIVPVPIVDDTAVEPNETFTVNLSNPVGATIADSQGVGTILDDDSARQITISDAAATEGSSTIVSLAPFINSQPSGLVAPTGIAVGPNGDLFVAGRDSNNILRYDRTTGTFLSEFVPAGSGGLASPRQITFGPDGNLYVAAPLTDEVLRYNGTTGAFLGAFVASGTGGLDGTRGIAFDAAGDIYVASDGTDQILKYHGPASAFPGTFISVFVNAGAGSDPNYVTFGPDGNLYVSFVNNVATLNDGYVMRYSGTTGALIDTFVPAGRGGLMNPFEMLFDAEGRLYLIDHNLNAVLRYQGPGGASPGAFIDTYVAPGLAGMNHPHGAAFDGQGNLLIASRDTSQILRYGPASTAVFTINLSVPSTQPVTVSYSTATGTATSGSDFTASSRTLRFAPGETSHTVLVQSLDDSAYEGNETFTVNLSSPVGGVIADGQGVGTIVDNDPPPPPPTKFYVVDDGSANKTYEYAANGAAVENYAVNSGNTAPRGAASTAAGDKVWVVDANKHVYVYDTSGGLLGSWTAGSLPSNASVQGITTNGTDVWIVDDKGNKVYRYAGAASRLSGSQNAASSFSLNSSNGNPSDLVTDGTSIWVVNNATGWFSTDKVFKYTVSGTLQGSWTISGGGGSPTGITIDPANVSNIWIVDSSSDRIYQFDGAASRTSGSQSPSTSFALAAGNTNPQGLADPPTAGGSAAYDSALLTIVGELDDVLGTGKKRR